MSPERFFELFCKELNQNSEMNHYYKFKMDHQLFNFRKNYFLERLRFIHKYINDPALKVFDCGCGYGTTALFLAMNGIRCYGETLEFYYKVIEERLPYWQQYGDVSLFTYSYENLFDKKDLDKNYDRIIVQDTLHHLEPINDALIRLNKLLNKDGLLVVVEENGNNIIQNLKLFKQRGNKRVIEIFDERLNKNILIGNENIRPFKKWDELLTQNGYKVDLSSLNYVRYYLPFYYKNDNGEDLLMKERDLSKGHSFKREYLFFGINFTAGIKNS